MVVIATTILPYFGAALTTDQFTWDAFTKAMCVVGVAEVVDKTWFMTVLLALNHGRRLAMVTSFAALSVHVFMAAFLGVAVSKFVSGAVLDFATSALFAVLAIMYAKDWYYADGDTDMIAQGREEAEESGLTKSDEAQYGGVDGESLVGYAPKKRSEGAIPWSKLSAGFVAVFIAEWGDRTQIAMVGLHSSLPVVPVFLGSLVAFFFLCLSAVMVAAVLEKHKVSERLVFGFVSLSFVLFACLSLHDGLVEYHKNLQGPGITISSLNSL
jgi:putative Ca2+/H+ antiporter (TMEM165/GDT1 family)